MLPSHVVRPPWMRSVLDPVPTGVLPPPLGPLFTSCQRRPVPFPAATYAGPRLPMIAYVDWKVLLHLGTRPPTKGMKA